MQYIGDIVIVLILLVSIGIGVKKGLLGLIVGFLAGILTLVLATLLSAPVAEALAGAGLKDVLMETFDKTFDFSNELYSTPIKSFSVEQIGTALAGLELPEFLSTALANLLKEKIADTSIGSDVSVKSVIIGALADVSLKAIAWLGLFLVLTVVFALLKKFVKVFDKIPLIGSANRILGAVVCLVIAVAIVCVVMYLFVLIAPSMPENVVAYVDNSIVLGWLYHNNPLAYILTKIFA